MKYGSVLKNYMVYISFGRFSNTIEPISYNRSLSIASRPHYDKEPKKTK